MELYYNLLGVYSADASSQEKAKLLAEELIETGYIEDDDVVELAKITNSVILIELEQEDGYMEFILVNNKGKIKSRGIFSPENTPTVYNEMKEKGPEVYFTKKALKEIDRFSVEYEMSRDEFLNECLDSYLMDDYEKTKYKQLEKIEKYYI